MDNTIDTTHILSTIQNRLQKFFKKEYQYDYILNDSDDFLKKNVFSHVPMAVMYVDMVGSTRLIQEVPPDKLHTLLTAFSLEVSYVIREYQGKVLKISGDAVIGYFVEEKKQALKHPAENAVRCSLSVIEIIKQALNPVLSKNGLPELEVKIGIDFGTNTIVRYGKEDNVNLVHLDILGMTMNLAAKMQGLAKPFEVLAGEDVYNNLSDSTKNMFQLSCFDSSQWPYTKNKASSNHVPYPLYTFAG